MAENEIREARAWPMRAFLLLALGAFAGLVIHWLTDGFKPWAETPLRLAAAAFVACGFVAFAFSFERLRWTWSVGFALLVGLVIGLVTWSNGPFGGWGSNEGWQIFSALLAITIAVPLFQTARDAGRPRLDYPSLHAHSWTNIVLWFATWGFVLVTYLLAQLLSELFNLIGIHVLRDLLRDSWFNLMLIGAAFGAAAGLFRDRDTVLAMLQRVITAILSVLTPFLAVGLVLFVLALPFTGLEPLWSQTKQTTPILLVCILGAFLLVNATIGPEDEPRAAWLRHSAMALAAVMLPLGAVAAVSLGKRIGQYGLTPERLWAAVFVFVALIAGALYLAAIARRRLGWVVDARRANIGLALGVCGLALLLALPLLSFGAISARDQVARLQSGKVSPDKFDWIAMRFDFGPSGQRAVAQLAREGVSPDIRRLAAKILALRERYEARQVQEAAVAAMRPQSITVVPRPAPAPDAIRAILYRPGARNQTAGLCLDEGSCILKWQPGDTVALALHDDCAPYPKARRYASCGTKVQLLALVQGQWQTVDEQPTAATYWADAEGMAQDRAIRAGRIEVRDVPSRQVFVDGKPIGPLFTAAQSSK